jgi:hypothetical protein
VEGAPPPTAREKESQGRLGAMGCSMASHRERELEWHVVKADTAAVFERCADAVVSRDELPLFDLVKDLEPADPGEIVGGKRGKHRVHVLGGSPRPPSIIIPLFLGGEVGAPSEPTERAPTELQIPHHDLAKRVVRVDLPYTVQCTGRVDQRVGRRVVSRRRRSRAGRSRESARRGGCHHFVVDETGIGDGRCEGGQEGDRVLRIKVDQDALGDKERGLCGIKPDGFELAHLNDTQACV